MHRTGQAHLLESFLQRMTSAMNSNSDIIERNAKARGDPIARLPKNVGAPNDIGIFSLEGGQQLVETVANHPVQFGVRLNGVLLKVGLIHRNLPATRSHGTALVVNYRGCKDATQPTTHGPNVAKL